MIRGADHAAVIFPLICAPLLAPDHVLELGAEVKIRE
jgi:hypothetical protein